MPSGFELVIELIKKVRSIKAEYGVGNRTIPGSLYLYPASKAAAEAFRECEEIICRMAKIEKLVIVDKEN